MGYKMEDNPQPEPEDFGLSEEDCAKVQNEMKKVLRRAQWIHTFIIVLLIAVGITAVNHVEMIWLMVYAFIGISAAKHFEPSESIYLNIPNYKKYSEYRKARASQWELRQIIPADDDPFFGKRQNSDK